MKNIWILNLDLPDDVVDAYNADRLLLFVGDDCSLGLDPDVPASLGQEAVLAGLALPLREYCKRRYELGLDARKYLSSINMGELEKLNGIQRMNVWKE